LAALIVIIHIFFNQDKKNNNGLWRIQRRCAASGSGTTANSYDNLCGAAIASDYDATTHDDG